jgi:hypothetical protein
MVRIYKDEIVDGKRYISWCIKCDSEVIHDDEQTPITGSCNCNCSFPERDWTMKLVITVSKLYIPLLLS